MLRLVRTQIAAPTISRRQRRNCSWRDSLQASEKGWGATAQMAKAVAEERGWEHGRHANFFEVVRCVVAETGDQEIWVAFEMARGLHENFYEGKMGSSDVDFHLGHVTRFTEKMRGLLDDN